MGLRPRFRYPRWDVRCCSNAPGIEVGLERLDALVEGAVEALDETVGLGASNLSATMLDAVEVDRAHGVPFGAAVILRAPNLAPSLGLGRATSPLGDLSRVAQWQAAKSREGEDVADSSIGRESNEARTRDGGSRRVVGSPESRKAWAGNSAYDAGLLLAAAQATVRVRFETRRLLNLLPVAAILSSIPLVVSIAGRGASSEALAFWGGQRCVRSSM